MVSTIVIAVISVFLVALVALIFSILAYVKDVKDEKDNVTVTILPTESKLVTEEYVDTAVSKKLNISGGTMTGVLSNTGQPRIQLLKKILQTIQNDLATILTWDEIDFNTGMTNTNEYINIEVSGLYLIGFETSSWTFVDGSNITTYITINNEVLKYGASTKSGWSDVGPTLPTYGSGSSIVNLNVNDKVRIVVFQDTQVSIFVPAVEREADWCKFWAVKML